MQHSVIGHNCCGPIKWCAFNSVHTRVYRPGQPSTTSISSSPKFRGSDFTGSQTGVSPAVILQKSYCTRTHQQKKKQCKRKRRERRSAMCARLQGVCLGQDERTARDVLDPYKSAMCQFRTCECECLNEYIPLIRLNEYLPQVVSERPHYEESAQRGGTISGTRRILINRTSANGVVASCMCVYRVNERQISTYNKQQVSIHNMRVGTQRVRHQRHNVLSGLRPERSSGPQRCLIDRIAKIKNENEQKIVEQRAPAVSVLLLK